MSDADILDLRKFVPKERYIYLTEKPRKSDLPGWILKLCPWLRPKRREIKIDLSFQTTRTTLELSNVLQKFAEASQKKDFEAVADLMYDIIVVACRQSFPEITREWLQENTSEEEALQIFQFILQPIKDKAEKLKNVITAQGPKN